MRPLILAVDFTAVSAREPLMEAVTFLREAFHKGKPLSQYPLDTVPRDFIPETVKRYLYAKDEGGRKRLIADRYEFLVYRQLKDGLEAVDISCRDSVHYRSFDDDLIDAEVWRQNKQELIAATGRSILTIPIREQLAALKEQLEERLTEVNRRIQTGEKPTLKSSRAAKMRTGRSRAYRPETNPTSQQVARKLESQNAGIPANKQSSIPESQHAINLEIQHNVTATEKVTYRFHPEGKYAIEDIKTILARKVGIKASYELIAEEAILIACHCARVRQG